MNAKIVFASLVLMMLCSCTTLYVNSFPEESTAYTRNWNLTQISSDSSPVKVMTINDEYVALLPRNSGGYVKQKGAGFDDLRYATIISRGQAVELGEAIKKVLSVYDDETIADSGVLFDFLIVTKPSATNLETTSVFNSYLGVTRTSVVPNTRVLVRLQIARDSKSSSDWSSVPKKLKFDIGGVELFDVAADLRVLGNDLEKLKH